MKAYLYLTILFILTFLFSCTLKKESVSIMLPEITLKDEQQEIFLQKKILIYEMISASKELHQISWPILKNNVDICKKNGSYSFGVLYASKEDLPSQDAKFYKKILNKNINAKYFTKYNVGSFPLVVSVAKNSPAFKANILEGDIILQINDASTLGFRKKLKKFALKSSKLRLTILRNQEVLEKEVVGTNICNYNVQAIPSPAPNAFADGEKVFITLAAIKLARTKAEMCLCRPPGFCFLHTNTSTVRRAGPAACPVFIRVRVILSFLPIYELAHNIFHYKYDKGSEAYNFAINYTDSPKIKSFSSFFLYSSQSKEIEADLKGVEIAFKGGYSLDNVNDYWRRLSVFNPEMISSSSFIYKSNALRAIMLSKTLRKLKNSNEKK